MITTVTLSPCIDKTAELSRLEHSKINRAENIRLDPGGKGINVCLALAALKSQTAALLLNFDGGDIITSALDREGIEYCEVKCPGRIRTNLKIYERDTRQTVEINEQNPTVPQKALVRMTELVRQYAKKSEILVLSGSIPAGVPSDIYKTLSEAAKAENPAVKTVLDAEGTPLLEGLKASPYLIKPNVEELERTFGLCLSGEESIAALSRRIIAEYGVCVVLVSMGDRGALAVTKCDFVREGVPQIVAKSAQGAGDAMVAGACYAIRKGLSVRDILRCGTCAAAGAVELSGTAFCSRNRFEELYAKM